jgi:hypothetical protein
MDRCRKWTTFRGSGSEIVANAQFLELFWQGVQQGSSLSQRMCRDLHVLQPPLVLVAHLRLTVLILEGFETRWA